MMCVESVRDVVVVWPEVQDFWPCRRGRVGGTVAKWSN